MKTLDRFEQLCRVNRRGGWLLGCGIVVAVIAILLIAGGIFVAVNMRGWAANGMQSGMTAMVAEAPIDDTEKVETQAVMDDFIGRFRDGSVSYQQLGLVFAEVMESPVLPAGVAIGVGHAYFEDAALTDEEKAQGRLQLERIAHGMASEAIEPAVLRDVLAPLRADPADTEAIQFDLNGQMMRVKTPENTTPDELRAFIEQARTTADANSLPEQPPSFDLSTELDRAIKTALGEPVDDGATEPGVIEVPVTPAPDAENETPTDPTVPVEEPTGP